MIDRQPHATPWLESLLEMHGFLSEHEKTLFLLALDHNNKTILRKAAEGADSMSIANLLNMSSSNIYARASQMRKAMKSIRAQKSVFLSAGGRLCIERPNTRPVYRKLIDMNEEKVNEGMEEKKIEPSKTPLGDLPKEEKTDKLDIDAITDAVTERLIERMIKNLVKRII